MKEFFKSLLLIALTVSAIVMTQSIFLEKNVSIDETVVTYEETDLIQYIRPQNYIFSFGDLFIKLYDEEYANINIRNEYEKVFTSFMAQSEFLIAKTNEDVWEEQIQRKSLLVNYPFDIKLSDFLDLYHFNSKTVGDINDIHITSILFLLNRDDLIYLYDGTNEIYYRLTGDEPSLMWINDLYDVVTENKSKADEYLTMEARYNFLKTGLAKYDLSEANMLLTPLSKDISYPTYKTVKEISSTGNSQEQLKIFGEDLSFVKKSVYADSSIIYMYGYGEKIYKVNADGSLEYIVQGENSNQNEAIEFKKGLSESVAQINKMGLSGDSLYMSDYFQIQNQNSVETVYYFNYTRNGIPLYTNTTRNGDAIEVRFLNTDLVKAKKSTRVILPQGTTETQSGKSFLNIVARNRLRFEIQYNEDRPESPIDDSDIFQMALHEMEELELKYYLDKDDLVPVWSVVIADTRYIINVTTGLIIEYYSN